VDKAPFATVHGHFSPKMMPNFSLQFSLCFREKTFWWSENKTLRLHLFFFLPTNQTHSKKIFFPISFPKFSIYPISLPNKHTLALILQEKKRE